MSKHHKEWEKYKGNHHPLLESFLMVAPYLNQLYTEDISMGVADTEKYLISTRGETIKLNINYGDPLAKGDAITEAINKRRVVRMMIPEDVFGFSIISTGIPLYGEKGEVIGGVGLGINISQYGTLYTSAVELSASVEQFMVALDELSKSSNILTTNMDEITKQTNEVVNNIKQIGEFSNSVKTISDQSHMLGINASIQASRAGEAGKGFSVVADEVKKMAFDSKENAEHIQKTVAQINTLIGKLEMTIKGAKDSTEGQNTIANELFTAMEIINKNASRLHKLSENMMNI